MIFFFLLTHHKEKLCDTRLRPRHNFITTEIMCPHKWEVKRNFNLINKNKNMAQINKRQWWSRVDEYAKFLLICVCGCTVTQRTWHIWIKIIKMKIKKERILILWGFTISKIYTTIWCEQLQRTSVYMQAIAKSPGS